MTSGSELAALHGYLNDTAQGRRFGGPYLSGRAYCNSLHFPPRPLGVVANPSEIGEERRPAVP